MASEPLLEEPDPGRRFSREQQAAAVFMSHALILITVLIIMGVGVHKKAPVIFIVCEGLICVLTATIFPMLDSMPLLFASAFKRGEERVEARLAQWRGWSPPGIFAAAFVLQFVALAPLLIRTGGPIDSPFAPLAIAFAVFTPLLANEDRTIFTALGLSLVYYWVMVELVTIDKLGQPINKGVFASVTTMILVLTVVLSWLDRSIAKQREERTREAG
jgi:hypothetical protein